MTDIDKAEVEHAIDALDKAMTERFGADYLIRKLEYLRREHALANGITVPRDRRAGLDRRRHMLREVA